MVDAEDLKSSGGNSVRVAGLAKPTSMVGETDSVRRHCLNFSRFLHLNDGNRKRDFGVIGIYCSIPEAVKQGLLLNPDTLP